MKSEVPWRIDENGMLLGARIHDGAVVRLAVVDNVSLELAVRRLSGDVVMIRLLGLREFNLREMWNGAIVSELFVWKVGSVPDEHWSIPDGGWNTLFAHRLR